MLTEQEQSEAVELLILDEDYKRHPYRCSRGKLTIGIGRNLDDQGISYDEAVFLCKNDINRCDRQLEELSFYSSLDTTRKIVLVNMCFNLGMDGLMKFSRMLDAVRRKAWKEASNEMVNSRWHKQVGVRAIRLERMMETGVLS